MKKLLLCASAFALMLGSCSKDDTEVTSITGDRGVVFTATMTIGNDTRTGMKEDEIDASKIVYTWDYGDMVGATVKGLDLVTPFINIAETGANAEFDYREEAVNYVGKGSEVYLVYPYREGNTVDADGKVKMTIPAKQTYREDSFAQMVAPAVSYTDNFTEGKNYTFKAVSSFIRVPLYGVGTIKSLTMQIKNSATAEKITGSALVDVAAEVPALGAPTEDAGDIITLDMGKGGVELSYTEPTWVVFVIPADVAIKANTDFEFKATFDDAATSTYTVSIPSTYGGTSLAVNTAMKLSIGAYFGMEDKVLIENNADLIEYLYTVSQDTDGDKTAVLVNDLNFSRYDARNDMNGAKGDMLKALTEYLTNGSVIESIAEGAHIDGNGHTISNLQVKGNGIFEGQPASLKNLTLYGVTVNVPAEANPALFVGAINLNDCSKDVVIKGGYLKNVAAGATAAMIQNAYDSTLPLPEKVTISYPRVNDSQGEFAYFAAKLTLNNDVDIKVNGDLKAYFNSKYRLFGAIKATSDVKISYVNAASVPYLLAAISYEGTDKAISVIDTKGTSYWTGGVAESVAADRKIETAEQLAYVVKNGGTATLAANIDLQGKDWKAGNGTLTIHGNKKKISNAVVVADETQSQFYTYSLLGNVVTADNLVVEGVEINVEAGSKPCVIGGVAYQGSATNVTVSNVTINVASDVQFYQNKYNHVGGLISHATAGSDGNTVSSVAIECNGNENAGPVGAMFGEVSGSFNKNALSESAIAMVGSWTIADTGSVEGCNSNSAIVENVFFTPVSSGVMSLTFDGCSTPCCNNLVNTTSNDIVVDITVGGETKTERLEPGVNKFNK